MSKILITGVAGFVGSNFAVRLLEEGHEVVGIDDLSHGLIEQVPEGVTFVKQDIRSRDIYPLFKDVNYVFHFAALSSIPECQNDPVTACDVNTTGTVNVFEASARAGVKKIIFAETSAVYEGIQKWPTPEDVADPHSVYAVGKMAARLFAKPYKEFRHLDSVGVRYFNVYGPRQDYRRSIPPLMSAFILALLRGEKPVIYGDGEKRRDFVYVDDVNDAHLLLMKDDRANNNIYNIGSGTNNSVNEIYKIIKNLLGADVEPVYKNNLEGEAQVTLADCSRLKGLGWQPKMNLEEGIKIQIDYLKKHVL